MVDQSVEMMVALWVNSMVEWKAVRMVGILADLKADMRVGKLVDW